MGQRIEELYELLELLADDSPCRLDHHGFCQEHFWLAPGRCPHARAQELLKERA